ncbi:MAG: extracellular solute-binding protein, partial [Treponema sp.]|jgi:putative aldouronate transport system substrate-binding protein|nr:extracellular solute-binding protein [Treponema sp.]
MDDNRWTRWVNENAPVKVKYVPISTNQALEIYNTLFAAGMAPDLIVDYNTGERYENGVIQPLDEYIEKYSTSYKKYINNEHPDLKPYVTKSDGKMYAFTTIRPNYDLVYKALIIRQDWLDKFGMKMPETIDEMLTFMRRARDEDPDGNGVKDTLGVSIRRGYNDIFMDMFGNPKYGFGVENGHFVDWASTQGYRDYLAFMALLYREELMDREFFTATNNSRSTQQMVTGKSAIHAGYFNGLNETYHELRTNVPSARWNTMDPPRLPNGQKHSINWDLPPTLYTSTMSTTAKNPQAVVQYIDWMLDTGWFTLTYGLEGIHYKLVDGLPQAIDADLNGVQLSYVQDYNCVTRRQDDPDNFLKTFPKDPISQEYAQLEADFYRRRLSTDKNRVFIPNNDPISDFEREFRTTINESIVSLETNIMMNIIPVDEGIRQINQIKKNAGYDRTVAERDAWYQQNKANFTSIK